MANILSVICALIGVILSHATGIPVSSTPKTKLSLTGLEYSAFHNKSLYAVKLNPHRNSYITNKLPGNQTLTVKKLVNSSGIVVNSATITSLNPERQLVRSTILGSLGRSLNTNKSDQTILIPLQGNLLKQHIEEYKSLGDQISISKAMPSSMVVHEKLNKSDTSNMRRYGEAKEARRAANTILPNAKQLDMAPARGAYVYDMRLKNKFCHRHVLWPEGPKYDSKGNTIMPLFLPKFYNGKDFFQTAKPIVVLPRCCNCCKKSVLGCQ